MRRLRFKINVPLLGLPPGTVFNVECGDDGVPTDKKWRKLLKDSKLDHCVEVMPSETESGERVNKLKAHFDKKKDGE